MSKKPFQKNGVPSKDENNKQSGDKGAKQEAELLFLHNIVTLSEEHNIPESLVMNLDQTPLKYVPVSHNMTKKGVKSVSIAGSGDKRGITGMFVITLDGKFLPIQLIYGGKMKQSLPRRKFPESFSLSVNPKHFSNTEKSIKIINEILVPHVEKEREKLGDKSKTSPPYFRRFQRANDIGSHYFASGKQHFLCNSAEQHDSSIPTS